jgi:hypothetical protein
MEILLTSTVSLLAAMIGAWIAGTYALRAQKHRGKRKTGGARAEDKSSNCSDSNNGIGRAENDPKISGLRKPALSAFSNEANVFRGRLRLQTDTRRLPNPLCLPDSATHS